MRTKQHAPGAAKELTWLESHWRIEPAWPRTFRLRERMRTFQTCCFVELDFNACKAFRGPSEAPASASEALCISVCTEGQLILSARTHTTDLSFEPGDILIWNPSELGSFFCPTHYAGITITFPPQMIEARIGGIEKLLGKQSAKQDPSLQLLSNYIVNLNRLAEDVPPARMISATASLLEMAHFYLPPPPTALMTADEEALLRHIQGRIRDDLLSGDWSAGAVAREFGISTRRVHALFSKGDQSLAEFVRRERLERARDALRSKAFSAVSITEIAHRFGYFDSAHFTRTFKRYYKVSPSKFRGLQSGQCDLH